MDTGGRTTSGKCRFYIDDRNADPGRIEYMVDMMAEVFVED